MPTFSFREFMLEGGWGMWPVLLLTLLVVIVHASITDVAAVFHYLEDPARAPDGQMARLLVGGLKESTRPAALGGVFLTLVPLLAAAGVYREYYRDRPASA